MKPLPELTSFLEGLPEPHILFDNQYRILAANAAYRRQFSPDHSAVGRNCFEVSHRFSVPCDQAGESCPMARSRDSGQRERVLHLHHSSKGEEYVNIELVPLLDATGKQAFYVEKMEPVQVAHSRAAAQGMIGRSPAFAHMLSLVARVAPSQATVLLLGESGTGKELLARAVHEASGRSHRALVPVDCSSMPENLFESELFGHERGAFTGANTARGGLIESASGGTLFLDEVGDIPLTIQVKLLRLLETGTYRRVGSTEQRHADIRVVSATHRDLDQMVAQGKFREDLYYRLSTFPIHLPSLRERGDDITLLASALLDRVSPHRKLKLSAAAIELLQMQNYPGNVRELRNLLERSALLCDGDTLEAIHVKQALQSGRRVSSYMDDRQSCWHANSPAPIVDHVSQPVPAPGALVSAALDALKEMANAHTGSRAELAAQLGISERSLYRKLKALHRH